MDAGLFARQEGGEDSIQVFIQALLNKHFESPADSPLICSRLHSIATEDP